MAPRRKQIDSISPTIVTRKSQRNVGNTVEEEAKDKPLLSIIEPENIVGDFVVPVEKKKRGRKKKNIEEIIDEANEVKTESKNSFSDKRWYVWSDLFKGKKQKYKEYKEDASEKQRRWKTKHKIIASVSVATGLLLIISSLLGGAAYAHQAIYQNKIFPGVMVWGEDVGGKSVTEVQSLIAQKAKDYYVVIKGPDQDYKATVADLGIIFNTDSMALSAYSRGRSDIWWEDYLTRARLAATEVRWKPWQDLIRSNDLAIAPSYTVNQEKLNAYLQNISDNIKIQARDSRLTSEKGITYLSPAIDGREVKFEVLKSSVLNSISELKYEKIDVVSTLVKSTDSVGTPPEVSLQVKNIVSRPVVLTYKGTEYRPNQDTVGSWIAFTKKSSDSTYTLVVDKTKMDSYFSFLGSKINIASVQRIVKVENGVKQTESQAGVDGLKVDTALLGSQIASTLPVQASVRLEIPTYVDKFKTKYENVVIADWDKYVDINLSTQTMIACERGGVNCRQWKITSGKDGSATPTGTFLVLGRSANFYMTGGTPGVDYYKVWVDRATWFTSQGHAIHDASWRNGYFGGNDYHTTGSHGCINSPDEAANFVYDWASIGTPVVIHY